MFRSRQSARVVVPPVATLLSSSSRSAVRHSSTSGPTASGGSSDAAAAAATTTTTSGTAGGWRQQVLERDQQEAMGLASDKTIASGAILSDKAYDEAQKGLGGGFGRGGSSAGSSSNDAATTAALKSKLGAFAVPSSGSSSSASASAASSSSAAGGSSSGSLGKSAAAVEASHREDVESDSFSPIDYYRRRLLYLYLVRARKAWVPAATYGALVYGMGAAANATATTLAMPHYLSAAALVALLNRFVVAGSSSKWVKKAQKAAKEAVSSASSAASADGNKSAAPPAVTALPLYRQVAVVTGATGALGREVALKLQALGAMVIVTHLPGSTPVFGAPIQQKADGTAATTTPNMSSSSPTAVITQTDAPADTIPMRSYPLDLADRSSVRAFCGLLSNDGGAAGRNPLAVPKIDIMVLGAGVRESAYVPTRHGTDRHVEVNFLGQFLLSESLLPLLRRSQYSGVDFTGNGPHHSNSNGSSGGAVSAAAATFTGLRGGRVVYVGCSDHAIVGQKVAPRAIASMYQESIGGGGGAAGGPASGGPSSASSLGAATAGASGAPTSYKLKWLAEGDDAYLKQLMYGVSKLGNIYHTMSLHDRRYNGIDGTALAGGLSAASSSSSSAPVSDNVRRANPLRPYTAVCAVLPAFQSYLARDNGNDELPAAVVEARKAAGLTFEGGSDDTAAEKRKAAAAASAAKKNKNNKSSSFGGGASGFRKESLFAAASAADGSSSSSSAAVTVPLIGSQSAAVSNEAAVQSFKPSELIGALWAKTPAQAADAVLDVCLRPDVASGGFYHENREMSQIKAKQIFVGKGIPERTLLQRILPTPAQCLEVLSAAANNLKMRQSLIGWAAQQTRPFTIDVPPYASGSGGNSNGTTNSNKK